jgi:hypothetical protein
VNDFSAHIYFAPCLHRRVVLDITGGVHFSAGEVRDNIQERLLCLDCMEYVTEADVRRAQDATFNLTLSVRKEVSHDHS